MSEVKQSFFRFFLSLAGSIACDSKATRITPPNKATLATLTISISSIDIKYDNGKLRFVGSSDKLSDHLGKTFQKHFSQCLLDCL